MQTCRCLTLALAVVGALAARVRADEVELTGGTHVVGDVLERSDAGVRLLQPGGDEITFAPGDVKKVVVDPDAPGGDRFTRFVRTGAHPGLQVGVAHYVKAGAPRVDLVGAVHAADAAYFRALQHELDRADTVLYEMVKPKDVDPAAKRSEAERSANPISKIQTTLARIFDLTYQTDGIDYRRRHFVHADMTAEEFLAQGGGTITKEMETMIARLGPLLAIAASFLHPSDDASESAKATAKSLRDTIKFQLASMLGDATKTAGALLADTDGDDLILGKRNDVAMKVFDATPKTGRSIAIFYGAAHMPDLEKRLLARGYVRAGGHWWTAWDVTPAKPSGAEPAGK